jgi:hypothetical protein
VEVTRFQPIVQPLRRRLSAIISQYFGALVIPHVYRLERRDAIPPLVAGDCVLAIRGAEAQPWCASPVGKGGLIQVGLRARKEQAPT